MLISFFLLTHKMVNMLLLNKNELQLLNKVRLLWSVSMREIRRTQWTLQNATWDADCLLVSIQRTLGNNSLNQSASEKICTTISKEAPSLFNRLYFSVGFVRLYTKINNCHTRKRRPSSLCCWRKRNKAKEILVRPASPPSPSSPALPALCCEPSQQLTSLRMNNECDQTRGSEVMCLRGSKFLLD